MPIQNFENRSVEDIITYTKEVISYTQDNAVIYKTIFELGKGKKANKKKNRLIELLKQNNYKVFEKIDNEFITILCNIGENI